MTEASTESFNLLIRLSNGQRIEVTIEGDGGAAAESSSISVRKVKESIAQKDTTAPVERQKLIYKGRILDNGRTLSDYGIEKGSTLFMVKSAAPPANPPATNANSSSTNSTAAPSPTPSFPPMMGNPFALGGQQQQQQQGGGMGMPNPEQMQAMLNSPHMQGLLDNPDLLGSMLENSMNTPQMQELMRNNPELRQLYNDPAMIQQAIQMMRNPQHMNQMMRQQDLAMSQLENMPGGFAALSNMYRNVQEPMLEAQQDSRRGDETTQANRSGGTSEGATGTAMPNPWGSPAPAPRANNNSNGSSNNAGGNGGFNPWAAAAGGGGAANPWAGGGTGGGGGGLPNPWGGGMPGMPGGMPQPNMDQMMQMLDNPMMSQMMNDMVQNNPDMIRSMLEAQNPMLRQMFQGNPEQANNFIRNMFNPQTMRQMMEMQRSMGGFPPMGGMPGMGGGMPDMGGGGGSGSGSGLPAPLRPPNGDMDFSNLLQQFQRTGIATPPAQVPPSNPADRYRNQLQSLYGMGFDDEQANLAALEANHGNLNRAVDQLLSSPPPAPAPAPADSASSSGNNDNEDAKEETDKKDE